MGWLAAHSEQLLQQAGFRLDMPLADEALAYAEQIIERYTQQPWGRTEAFTATVRVPHRTYALPLPAGTTTVSTINGYSKPTGTQWIVSGLGLERLVQNVFEAWEPGTYIIAGQCGSVAIPQDVLKAASLLVNHFLRLSDADRSQFENYARGDFSGTMRHAQVPVPEAQALLQPYAPVVRGGLV